MSNDPTQAREPETPMLHPEFERGYVKGAEDCKGSVDKMDAQAAEIATLRVEVARLTTERDELLLDRHNPGRISPCGHYRVFAMPLGHEDGSESPYCMQCDRDARQDEALALRASHESARRAVEEIVEEWRKEEAKHHAEASAQAPMGGSLYVRHHAMWQVFGRCADRLSALLSAVPPSDERRVPEDAK